MNNGFTIKEGFNPKGQAGLIVKGFGLSALKTKFYNAKPISNDEYSAVVDGDLNKDKSLFGLPVFDVLEFDKLEYTELNGNKKSIEKFSLGTVLIDVSMSKNIVTTAIQGRNGTVKEYISDGDYYIMIKGVLVGEGQEVKPQDLKSQLIEFCKAPVEFSVASPLLNDFGVYTIVIDNYNFPQIEGQRNTVPFELYCLSDSPIELKSQMLS